MPTQCSARPHAFARVENRSVVAAFDGGAVTSDAGALLLGSTDRAVRLLDRFAGCFTDHRRSDLIEHEVSTLVGQRVFGIALGYEDLNDHDQLRHDPVDAHRPAASTSQVDGRTSSGPMVNAAWCASCIRSPDPVRPDGPPRRLTAPPIRIAPDASATPRTLDPRSDTGRRSQLPPPG